MLRKRIRSFSSFLLPKDKLEEIYKYCEKDVKKFHFGTYTIGKQFPSNMKIHYFIIHSFIREIHKSREISAELSVVQNRLLWWDQILNSIEQKEDSNHKKDLKDSNLSKMLLPMGIQYTAENTPINFSILRRIVHFQLHDTTRLIMPTMRDLEIFAENTGSLGLYLNLNLLKITEQDSYKAASHVGICLGICHIIKNLPYYFSKRRAILPTDLEIKYGILGAHNWDDKKFHEGRNHLKDAIWEIASFAKRHLELAREYKIEKYANIGLLISVECEWFLKRLEKEDFDVLYKQFWESGGFSNSFKILIKRFKEKF